MTTDDRDIESSNPSSFKVGEADRLSGFFTPVWESKRRLRAESPIPASSAAASAPSSSRISEPGGAAAPGAVSKGDVAAAPGEVPAAAQTLAREPLPAAGARAAGASRASSPPPPAAGARRPSSPPAAAARRPSSPPAAGRPSSPPASAELGSSPAASSSVTRGASSAAASEPRVGPAQRGLPAVVVGSGPPRASRGAVARGAVARGAASDPGQRGSTRARPIEPAPSAAGETLRPPVQGSPAQPRTQRQGSLLAAPPEPASVPSGAAAVPPGASSFDGSVTPVAPAVGEAFAAGAEPPLTPAPPADLSAHPVAAALAAAAAASVSVRPVIPMPRSPGRLPPRSKPPSSPPDAAAEAGRSGADLEPHARNEREPGARAAAGSFARPAPGAVERSARAVSAAGAVHGRLRTKLHIESDEVFGRHRETESEREALQAAATRAASAPAEPFPGHVLRTLRRTIHLSTPLSEDVRQMLAKYR